MDLKGYKIIPKHKLTIMWTRLTWETGKLLMSFWQERILIASSKPMSLTGETGNGRSLDALLVNTSSVLLVSLMPRRRALLSHFSGMWKR